MNILFPNRIINRVVGTGKDEEDKLQAAIRTAWIYVGRLKETTTSEILKNYMTKRGIPQIIECQQLDSRSRNKSFKVRIPFQYLETINEPQFWPEGVIVRRFRFQSPRGETNRENDTNKSTAREKSKEKKKDTIKTLLWNIEGLKSATQLVPKSLFMDYDAVILKETFLKTGVRIISVRYTHLLLR
mgnify:FL=1